MPRILYLIANEGGIQGGDKMVVRHVETLRDLGFDAYCYIALKTPTWFEHRAPMLTQGLREDDIVVLPDDAAQPVERCARRSALTVIFSQNPYMFAASGSFAALDHYPPGRLPTFIAVAPRLAATIRRLRPEAEVEIVPCFADERLFHAADAKSKSIAAVPRKRMFEANAIRRMFERLHPEHAALGWALVSGATELQTAQAFAMAGAFLSLSRLESVGMTTLEAMASDCVCAGFTGVGGAEYATPENGFWAPEDDCEAAADTLAQAVDLLLTGGAPLQRRLEAGRETARRWSYAAFRPRLEEVWMRLAPEARLSAGPLD